MKSTTVLSAVRLIKMSLAAPFEKSAFQHLVVLPDFQSGKIPTVKERVGERVKGDGYTVQTGNCADLLADEGKQWLALYASKNSKAGSGKPLTPDIVVKTQASVPEGYDGNIHLFGEKGAVNAAGSAFREYTGASKLYQGFTSRYKVYVFCKLSADVKTYDESAGNMTASAIGNGKAAIFGFGGLALGAVLGAVVTVLVKKKKKPAEE